MFRKIGYLVTAVVALALVPDITQATTHDFYKGKTIRVIVGLAPGGGYDLYARTIARHMGKHIPGNPVLVVENMTGAGSLIATNYLYKVAKPDGLIIGHFLGGLLLQQLLGKAGIEFDAPKFGYIGAPAQDHFMLGVSKATGITDVGKWIAAKTVVKFGGVSPGSGTDDIPNVLKTTLGLPIQVVTGYQGTGPLRLAFDSGEVQGVSNSWESFSATWRKQLDAGDVVIVLQATIKPHPDWPKVPVATDLAKTDDAKKLISAVLRVHGPSVRPFVVPPGTAKERLQLLRKAFIETLRDPELVAEAKKAKLDINPLDGEELERNVREVFKLEPALLEKLKGILQ